MKLKSLAVLLLLCLFSPAAQAVKVQKLPFVSDFHMGVSNGVGFGLDFGFDAGIDLWGIKLGPEIEQLILDVDYSASINATRYGGYLTLPLTRDLNLNLHAGSTNFQVTKANVRYTVDGTVYTLPMDQKYSATYQAVSLDYILGDYKLSPKLVYNMVAGQGVFLREFDFNLARSF